MTAGPCRKEGKEEAADLAQTVPAPPMPDPEENALGNQEKVALEGCEGGQQPWAREVGAQAKKDSCDQPPCPPHPGIRLASRPLPGQVPWRPRVQTAPCTSEGARASLPSVVPECPTQGPAPSPMEPVISEVNRAQPHSPGAGVGVSPGLQEAGLLEPPGVSRQSFRAWTAPVPWPRPPCSGQLILILSAGLRGSSPREAEVMHGLGMGECHVDKRGNLSSTRGALIWTARMRAAGVLLMALRIQTGSGGAASELSVRPAQRGPGLIPGPRHDLTRQAASPLLPGRGTGRRGQSPGAWEAEEGRQPQDCPGPGDTIRASGGALLQDLGILLGTLGTGR